MHNLWTFVSKRRLRAARSHDSLEAFATERPAGADPAAKPIRMAIGGALVIGLVSIAAGLSALNSRGAFAREATGTITIQSDPSGATVWVNGGDPKGVTPLLLGLPAGEHNLELVLGERRQGLRAAVKAGSEVVHHVQFAEPSAPRVEPIATSGPVARPATPAPRETTGPLPPAGPAAGWLVVKSPIPLHVIEKGQVLGTTDATRIMLQVGRRDLQFVNEALGFSEKRAVQVTAGGTSTVGIQVPRAPLSINALPWAEVFVDGVRLGETPIGNHPVPLGEHEIIFRHPEFGERRQTVTVSTKGPARASVDMRRSK